MCLFVLFIIPSVNYCSWSFDDTMKSNHPVIYYKLKAVPRENDKYVCPVCPINKHGKMNPLRETQSGVTGSEVVTWMCNVRCINSS